MERFAKKFAKYAVITSLLILCAGCIEEDSSSQANGKLVNGNLILASSADEIPMLEIDIITDMTEISYPGEVIGYEVHAINKGSIDLIDLPVVIVIEENEIKIDDLPIINSISIISSIKAGESVSIYNGNYVVSDYDIYVNRDNAIVISAYVGDYSEEISIPLKYRYTQSVPEYNGKYDIRGDSNSVVLLDNLSAVNVTYDVLLDFMKSDKTDLISRDDNNYVCSDYAMILHNNAEMAGIRCGYVHIEFTNGYWYACNAFDVDGKGTVIVSSENVKYPVKKYYNSWDTKVDLRIDKKLKIEGLYTPYDFELNGRVKDYKIYW